MRIKPAQSGRVDFFHIKSLHFVSSYPVYNSIFRQIFNVISRKMQM